MLMCLNPCHDTVTFSIYHFILNLVLSLYLVDYNMRVRENGEVLYLQAVCDSQPSTQGLIFCFIVGNVKSESQGILHLDSLGRDNKYSDTALPWTGSFVYEHL